MEAMDFSREELEEMMSSVGMRVFDPAEEEDILDDEDIAERNYRFWREQRGRTCEYPGCTEKLRYTRVVPCCWKHEDTEFAECHPAAEPGSTIRPCLYGLRSARAKRGLTPTELAQICGRTLWWVYQAERGRHGVADELRRLLASVLNVSEAYLLEGSE